MNIPIGFVMMFFSAQRRLKELASDLAETQSEVKALRIEWDETYEKLLKLYRKTATERAKLEKASTPEPDVPAHASEDGNGTSGSLLTPKQRLIQQQILQRRAHMK